MQTAGHCGAGGFGNSYLGTLAGLQDSLDRRRPQASLPHWKTRLIGEIGATTLAIADAESQCAAVVQRVETLLDAINAADAHRRASLAYAGRDHHKRIADAAAKEADALLAVRWDHPQYPRSARPLPPTAGEIRRGLDRYRKIAAARVDVHRTHVALLEAFLREDGSQDRAWSAESVAEQKLAALMRGVE